MPILLRQIKRRFLLSPDLRSLHRECLNQAGVETEFIRPQDRGIRGNGHTMMIEKNNSEIARLLDEWMQKT
jgi:hypothetical protein